MQLTLLPYIAAEIGGIASDIRVLGTLLTVFSLLQMLGSTVFGRFADFCGGRTALLVAYACSVLSSMLLYSASSASMLFISRLPALGQHALHASQLLVSLNSQDAVRASSLGRLGVSYGIGFAVGPLAGGYFATHYSVYAAIGLSILASVTCLVLTAVFVQDPPRVIALSDQPASAIYHVPQSKLEEPDEQASIVVDQESDHAAGFTSQWNAVRAVAKHPVLRPFLVAKACGGLALALFHASFSMLGPEHLQFSAQESGFVIAFVGFVAMVSQGLIVGRLAQWFQNREFLLIQNLALALAVSFGFLTASPASLIPLCAALIPIVVCGSVVATVVTSHLTKLVSPRDVGTVLGLDMTINGTVRAAAPVIAGFLVSIAPQTGFLLVGMCSASISIALWYAMRNSSNPESSDQGKSDTDLPIPLNA